MPSGSPACRAVHPDRKGARIRQIVQQHIGDMTAAGKAACRNPRGQPSGAAAGWGACTGTDGPAPHLPVQAAQDGPRRCPTRQRPAWRFSTWAGSVRSSRMKRAATARVPLKTRR